MMYMNLIATIIFLVGAGVQAQQEVTLTEELRTERFIPPHTRGDRDFDMADDRPSPYVIVQAKLVLGGDQLWAEVYMKAEEPVPDHTTAEGSRRFPLWKAPAGKRIIAILSDRSTTATYIDGSCGCDDVLACQPDECANRFVCTGDTYGDEAGTLTGVTVFFNAITMLLE